MYYLYRMLHNNLFVEDAAYLQSFLDKNKMKLCDKSISIGGIHSVVCVVYEECLFTISEFPGNCSSIVLSGIETHCEEFEYSILHNGVFNKLIKIIIKFCQDCGYGNIFISLTRDDCIEASKKLGFVTVWKTVNPHSGLLNTFLVLAVEQTKEE